MSETPESDSRGTAAFVLNVIGWTLVVAGALSTVVVYLVTMNVLSVASGLLTTIVGASLLVFTRVLRSR
jgi:hypothetical protein